MPEAKAYKITKVNAVDTGIKISFPLNYLVTQDNEEAAYVRNEEFAQRIAAALNFFDIVMSSLKSSAEKGQFNLTFTNDSELPDKFVKYIVAGSWISKIGYDFSKKKLRLWKFDGSYITHLDVPLDTWLELRQRQSVGAGYNNLIRGKFPVENKGK